ncbi:peptidase [Dictyobacter sp. S3.2.2.5]|uniref:Peptidase n=1 Tax=Dictyobacter halimunensis TaxID=3026934 RepID=A0ABQ6FL68_9CHLR|nr:peptidase [Dictyobacter sp. S3.2.2.5]
MPEFYQSTPRVPVTYENYLHLRYPSDPVISPDGKQAAFVVMMREPDSTKWRRRIWLTNTSDAEPRQWTREERNEREPRWSPDGTQLAFVGEENGKFQLFVRSLDSEHSRRVCTLPGGVSDISWSPDGKRLAFISQDQQEKTSDPIVLGPGPVRRLWTVQVESDQPAPVTPDGVTVWEYRWSPAGQSFALYFSYGSDETDWYNGQVGIVSTLGGMVGQITQLMRQASSLAWSPDSQQIAYISGEWSDPDQGGGDIYVVPAVGGEPRNLTPGIDASPNWCRWLPDGERLLFLALHGVTCQLGIVHAQDGTITMLDPDFAVDVYEARLSVTTDLGQCVTVHSTSQQPPDVWHGELVLSDAHREGMHWRRLSRLNVLAEESFALSPNRRLRYPGADAWLIDALFTPPLNYQGDGLPPLYVDVHGGPSGASLDSWYPSAQILASAGYAVLRPNMRGSWGRGVAFADAVLGDMGGKDFQDIMHGVDFLIEQGLVDASRIAIGGWSNGGFLTAWAITQTGRFKAAMVGAGITDWHNMHAQTNIADADVRLLKANPLENPDAYRRCSPLTYAGKVTTPTLIVHGENDPAVPVAQAYAFYRALREVSIPVECVIYPREGHGLSEPEHNRDYYKRLLAWLDRYV